MEPNRLNIVDEQGAIWREFEGRNKKNGSSKVTKLHEEAKDEVYEYFEKELEKFL
jgi:hypothetical protein